MNKHCLAELEKILLPDQLLTDAASCVSYSYDNGRHHQLPMAIVFPYNAEQVQSIIYFCNQHAIALTARGRGTGTPGGAVPTQNSLLISFERMNRIIVFCPESRYMIVEPGVLNQTVQILAASKNLLWGPDPSSQAYCTVGGNVAYNAGGPHTLKYGATKDNVLYLEAVTGAGVLIKTGCPVTKSSSGYDLTRLLVGSEGTLALFTQICLKLSVKPQSKVLLQAYFPTETAACDAVIELMNQPIVLSALEFMDKNCLVLLREHSSLAIPAQAQALLFIEIEGCANQLLYDVKNIQEKLHAAMSCTENSDAEQAWLARKTLSPILRQLAPYKINEDVVVPIHQLNTLLQKIEQLTSAYGLLNVNFGHAGNGNLHINLLLQRKEQISQAQHCLEQIFTEVIALNGTLSGEHGIGLEKKSFLPKAYSDATINLMRSIKSQFDPNNILNPDKLLP